MIFMRYKGPDIVSRGVFQKGKVYLGKPEMEDGETVELEILILQDEDGKTIRVHPDENRFDFMDQAYCVTLENFDEFEKGDVLVVDDIRMNGHLMFRVQGFGYRNASTLCVLDSTNVFHGVTVMEFHTGEWRNITKVDECLWIAVGGDSQCKCPTEFIFPVSEEGELMSCPIATCVEGLHASLTEGNKYIVHRTYSQGYVVEDDLRVSRWFMKSRFRMG